MTVKLTKPTRATAADAGCWFDGANRGWRMSGHVVELAHSYGMTLTADDLAILDAFDNASIEQLGPQITLPSGQVVDLDSVFGYVVDQGEMCDQAEQWLNDHIAPEGHYFGFWDGSFYLGSLAWWDDEIGE